MWAALRPSALFITNRPMLPKQKLHKQVIIIQGCRLEVSFAVIQYCNNDKAFYNSEMASELTKDGYHFFYFLDLFFHILSL